jgi:rSAM/selenodomain-associated transferase 2
MSAFSIIIPVLHEESFINKCLDILADRSKGNNIEIIVIDGDPNGSTINNIKAHNILKLVSSAGRAKQMNLGAQIAKHDILLFLHADTSLPQNAFSHIEKALQTFKAGAFDITFIGPRVIYKILSLTVSWRARLEQIPYGDQAIFMRKSYFQELGGYAEIPIMEDVELMLRIKKRGDRIKFISNRVITSARRWEAEGVIFTMLRNPILSFLFYRGVSPEKLANYYKSGKLVYKAK